MTRGVAGVGAAWAVEVAGAGAGVVSAGLGAGATLLEDVPSGFIKYHYTQFTFFSSLRGRPRGGWLPVRI